MVSVKASSSETCSLEKHLTCSICMDTFEDPVTTACGHSFCKKCLNFNFEYNDRVCPLCKKPQIRIPDVNIILRDIAQHQKVEKTPGENDDTYTGKDGEVACDICTEKKLKAKKSCLMCLASYCSTHLGNHSSTERLKGHKLVAPVKNLDDRACLKHGRPLELYSGKQQRCICVLCLEEGLEEVVSTEDEWEKKKGKLENAKKELEAKIKKRETQLDEINTSLKSCKDQLENDWCDIEAVFTAVIAIVEEAQAKALQPLKDRRQVIEKEAKDLKKDLEAEISRFKTTISELDDISTLEDHIHFLQSYPTLQDLDDIKDWAEVEFNTSLSFGTMRKTTAIMMEQIQQELEKLTSTELKRVPKFAVDVKLDPTTAHQRLVLSDDGKEVKDGGDDQEVDDEPERFDMFGSILGINSLTSGKSYWEVEVSNKSGWDLGVARGDAKRKGKLSLNPDNGYWVTVHYEDQKYAALTEPPVCLSLKKKPEKVGVFVDYEEGLLSFYNVTAQSHIFTFTECWFSDELFPYFSPHLKQDDKNGDPLIISAVKLCEQDMDDKRHPGCILSIVTRCVSEKRAGRQRGGVRARAGRAGAAAPHFPQRKLSLDRAGVAVGSWYSPVPRPTSPAVSDWLKILNTSDMSLQVCNCGWSKVTTYHGLRTHQGKMGCTPNKMRIPESEQFRMNMYLPQLTYMGPPIKLEEPMMDIFTNSDSSSDVSLQVCHCGWSEFTSKQGLRIHQKGCAPKGMSVWESEEYIWRKSQQKDGRPVQSTPVMKENVPASPNLFTQMNPAATEASVIEMIKSLVENQHQSLQMAANLDRTHRALDFITGSQVSQAFNALMHPAAADVRVKETNKAFFETPQRAHQTAPGSDRARRALDFSTGAQRAQGTLDSFEWHAGEQIQVHPANRLMEQAVWGPRATTAQETAVCPKEKEREEKKEDVREEEREKEREAQKLLQARQDRRRAELQQKIQIREHKVAEVRLSAKGCKRSLDEEWLEISNVFSEVVKVVEDAWQKALQPLDERRRKVKREAKDLVQKLEGEIDKLKKTMDELDKNPDLQVSLDDSREWKNVSVDTSFSFGTLRATTSVMMEQIHLTLEKLSSVELSRIPAFAVDVKLDPSTAHQCLVLSDDGKKVRDGGKNQKVPDTPERFDMFGSVLGRNSLTSGKSYWEVEVSNKHGWDLGVARGDANRKGKLSMNPDNGYWVTVHYEGKLYAALTAPPASLPLKEKPEKVGVFVDYEEGLVSFYDVTAQSHIHSFTECSFSGEIFPYFSPHLQQNGKNSDPLVISAVQKAVVVM
ncbi:uncharacterized protein LOC120797724 [Xiphias gladius]|uniref:uncharacterized protein LOC120797724 n=1 Tax=Xiphias gladius TaxID=8245 RepID=UPI001A98DB52|nr:uncharacterized protein LOC120797724 [Xiphias gladius]